MEQQNRNVTKLPLVGSSTRDVPALVAVIRRLSVAHSIQEIMEIVTPAARSLLKADGITFVLREADLCYYAEEDAISPLWQGSRFPMSACISGWCMTERQGAVIRDIYEDPRIPQDAYKPTFVRSLAMVPVRQDDPIAAMGAYWSVVRDATQRELDLLQTLANSVALALAKVQLEQEREKAGKAQLELSHRIRNLLSVVEAISRQTLRSASGLEEFADAFSGRLQALARAQTLLYRSGVAGADVRTLVREQLIMGGDDHRIVCRGSDAFLAADEAFDLGLILHELGTNARKYGALSSDAGRVTIEWCVKPDGDRRMLALSWKEEGGPPVTVPAVGGFGSTLLRSAFRKNGGAAHVRYEPSGVICNIQIALP